MVVFRAGPGKKQRTRTIRGIPASPAERKGAFLIRLQILSLDPNQPQGSHDDIRVPLGRA
jgi:hypothetical protein